MAVLHCIRANASKSRFLIALLLVMGSLTLTACGGDGGGGSNTRLAEGGTGDTSVDGSSDDGDTTVTAVKMGNGLGDNYEDGVVAVEQLTLQAGGTTTLRLNVVNGDNSAFNGAVEISLVSDCASNGLASFFDPSAEDPDIAVDTITTNTSGYAAVNYSVDGCSGEDDIVATAVVSEQQVSASATLEIEADQVLAIEFVEASTTSLSLAGMGGNEIAEITFRLVGAQGANIVGESVTFTIKGREGDANIADGRDSAVSNSDGLVSTILNSGTVATNIQIVATHDATQIAAVSDSITISSGLPIEKSFSFTQSSYNPPLSFNGDGVPVTLSILAADQFGNRVTEGTQVSFWAECGVVDATCLIDAESKCSVTWESNTANQDDGDYRCSLLAFTEGVETFTDRNGNFVYESTDVFDATNHDLVEPWLDSNENGSYEIDEPFVDTAWGVDLQYDLANGQWDGLCLAGTYPTAVCDGDDSAVIFAQGLITITCDYVSLLSSNPTVGSTIDISGGGSSSVSVVIEDACVPGNPPGEGTTISFTGEGIEILDGGSQTVPETVTGPVGTSVSFRGDDTSEPGELKLVVTAPGGNTRTFFWTVID